MSAAGGGVSSRWPERVSDPVVATNGPSEGDVVMEQVVSPGDIDEARAVLAAVALEARRRAVVVATGAALDAPVIRVVVDEASVVLADGSCCCEVETLARMAGTARVRVVLRDAFPDGVTDRPPLSSLGMSLLIRDTVAAGVFEVERLPMGHFVPLLAFGLVDDAISNILGGGR